MSDTQFKRILVTGGAGAIGSQVAKKLLDRGYSVVVVDDESSGSREFVPAAAEYIKGSIEDESILDFCFAKSIDAVIHCAALFANQNSIDHPEKDLLVNGLATVKLLAFSKRANVKRFLFTSSSCVYGRQEEMNEEKKSFDLETPYAITKLLGEQYCQFWGQFHQFNTVIVRIFNNYGPGEIPGKYRNVIPNFFQLALSGKPLIITGDGSETRDFNFVEDTTDGILLAFFSQTQPGDIFNIGSGVETTIKEVAEMINNVTGNKSGIIYHPPRSWDHVKRRKAIIAKAKKNLGYQPKIGLRDGLIKTCSWFRSRNITL
jgi:UDP-glucose 4-epimerase